MPRLLQLVRLVRHLMSGIIEMFQTYVYKRMVTVVTTLMMHTMILDYLRTTPSNNRQPSCRGTRYRYRYKVHSLGQC